jgi:hypothetical protein
MRMVASSVGLSDNRYRPSGFDHYFPTNYNVTMTTITLEIPDQLAAEIEPIRDELPVLLAITQQLFRPVNDPDLHTAGIYLAYKQMLDFLATFPSPEQISQFIIAPEAQARVHELLDKHGEGELSREEQAELRVYQQMNELMSLKKAQAALALATLS